MVTVSNTFMYVVFFILGIVFTIVSTIGIFIYIVNKETKEQTERLNNLYKQIANNNKDNE
jgi:threonine/homoserine/homoserine lactone efflux protein